jgi:hypothetical protein
MNRRVILTVTDGQGRVVGAGGAPEAIKGLESSLAKLEECCSQILKRLDKLDEILALLKELKDENAAMRKALDELRAARPAAPAPPAPPPSPPPVAAQKVAEQYQTPKFSLLGLNVGVDDTRNLTFTGRGQFFAPFKENFAFQAQGEYMYFRPRKEGQIDFGLVTRWRPVQLGAFASFRTISWRSGRAPERLDKQRSPLTTCSAAAVSAYSEPKGFLDKDVVNTRYLGLSRNILEESTWGLWIRLAHRPPSPWVPKPGSKATSVTCTGRPDSIRQAVRSGSSSHSTTGSRLRPRAA